MSSDSISMVTGVMHSGGLTMSPPAVDGLQGMSEEDKFQERKRDILVLVMRFLADYGFIATYQTLCAEASTSLDQVDAADNIDLMTIVQEFVDYYHSKFGRYPKLIRRNYAPPVAFQMQQLPGQQLPQAAMQQMQAMQLQAAVAAAQAAAQAKVQQQRQQQPPVQKQQIPVSSAALQMMPPQSLAMTQPNLLSSQRSVAASMALSGLPGMSEPLPVMSMGMPSIQPTTQPVGSENSMQSAGNSPTHQQQQRQQDCQSALLLQRLQQQSQQQQYMQAAGGQQPQQQQQRVIPAKAPVERVQITYLDNTQGSTCKIGTAEAIDQVGFVALLGAAPADELPSRYLSYKQPSKKSKRGSERFNASDLQEEVMYALVGCSDIGWSARNITTETREFLQRHYSIEKSTITTFFKNRSQRKPYSNPADGSSKRSSTAAASGRYGSRTGSSSGGKAAAAKAVAAAKVAADAAAVRGGPLQAAAAAGCVLQDYSMLALSAVPAAAATPATPAAAEQGMTTAEAAAGMADCDGLQDGTYGGLDGLSFRGYDSFCRQPSLTGLATSMSLPCGLDAESYLGADLDMTAAAMGMMPGEICCSPCGFSS